jgi:DNA-binding response OmpR family regulator
MKGNKPTILIVEADLPTLDLYCQALSGEFITVGTLKPEEALEYARLPQLRAVVIEPRLKNEVGWELAKEIRCVLLNKATPIILCSTLDERKRGIEMGAAAYLVKPVMPSELSTVVQSCLDMQLRRVRDK